MLAVALEQARIGFAEGGVPVGGAIFHVDGTLLGAGHNRLVQEGNGSLHGETDAFRAAGRRPTWHDTILVTTLAPCWYCSGLIYQFRFRQVIVGDSVNAQGGMHWLTRAGHRYRRPALAGMYRPDRQIPADAAGSLERVHWRGVSWNL